MVSLLGRGGTGPAPGMGVATGRARETHPCMQADPWAPLSLPGSAEPPVICEISPLVSYSGEVSTTWGSSGIGLV